MLTLISYLNSIHPLPDQLQDYLTANLRSIHLPKKGFLLQPGQTCRNIYFIKTGFMHRFRDGSKNDITLYFAGENQIVYSAESFFQQKPADESLQAIEPTDLLYLSYRQLFYIIGRYAEFAAVFITIIGHYQVARDNNDYALRCGSVKERYKHLLVHQPAIVQRAPNKLLALYLHCSPVYLSYIKKRI